MGMHFCALILIDRFGVFIGDINDGRIEHRRLSRLCEGRVENLVPLRVLAPFLFQVRVLEELLLVKHSRVVHQ